MELIVFGWAKLPKTLILNIPIYNLGAIKSQKLAQPVI